MSDKNLHKRVTSLSASTVDLPLHQRARKARLLAQYSSQRTSQNFVSAFMQLIKEGSSMKKVSKTRVIVGGFASFAVVAAVVALVVASPSGVSAAQQLSKTTAAVREMSPEEKADLNRRVGEKLAERLSEAQRSSNLKYISGEDFQKATGINPSVKLAGLSIKSYLSYITPNGSEAVIVVDSADKPILVIGEKEGAWAAESAAVEYKSPSTVTDRPANKQ